MIAHSFLNSATPIIFPRFPIPDSRFPIPDSRFPKTQKFVPDPNC
ncbi:MULTISPECIES: hypothetical protein [Moorena]|nr:MULTISPECIES: hypothetical protein [Moorena]